MKKMSEGNKRPVEITYPSGRVGIFNSRTLATLFVPFSRETLACLLKGETNTFSKKGYSARYLP
jgi:hypothetical protein